MKVAVLVGGVGGARFLLGVKKALGLPPYGEAHQQQAQQEQDGNQVTGIVNICDDIWLHGLRICPDLDTCMYTLGGGIDEDRGWGRRGETWAVKNELAAYGAEPSWFGLGDADIATHLIRTRMLRAGYPLSAITESLCERWRPGITLLPASDDQVETHVLVEDEYGIDQQPKAMHFQEWWVRHGARLKAHNFVSVGAQEATPAPGVVSAIENADIVLLAPSNPVVSIDTILAIPGIRNALRTTRAPVLGISPIVGGRALRGMAEACLDAIGVDTSAEAVGRHYGSRTDDAGGILNGWLVHTGDTAEIDGVSVRSVPLLMSDVDTTAAMTESAFHLAGAHR